MRFARRADAVADAVDLAVLVDREVREGQEGRVVDFVDLVDREVEVQDKVDLGPGNREGRADLADRTVGLAREGEVSVAGPEGRPARVTREVPVDLGPALEARLREARVVVRAQKRRAISARHRRRCWWPLTPIMMA